MQEEIKEILDYLKDFIEEDRLEQINLNRWFISSLLDYITNLQEENEYFNHCDEEKIKKITNLEYKIERLEEENKQLKELCDKYEEEHNIKFNEWVFDKRENEKLRIQISAREEIINKAIEYIELGLANEEEAEELLDILQGVDKE